MDIKTPEMMRQKRAQAERLLKEAERKDALWRREAGNMPKASVPGSVRRKLAKAQREAGDGR